MVAGVREERIDESGKKESPATGNTNRLTFILKFTLNLFSLFKGNWFKYVIIKTSEWLLYKCLLSSKWKYIKFSFCVN